MHARELIRSRSRFEAATVGLRLALSVARRFGLLAALQGQDSRSESSPHALLDALRFVLEQARSCGVSMDNHAQWQAELSRLRASEDAHPLSRLAHAAPDAATAGLILDLVLLSGLPEWHEGWATLFRLLHPQAEPYPSVTLALHWLEDEAAGHDGADQAPVAAQQMRDRVEDLLLHSSLARIGLLQLPGDGPWHGRLLRPGPGVWQALNARPLPASQGEILPGFRDVPGLENWLQQGDVQQAVTVLRLGAPCLIALVGGSEAMRITRGRALLGASGMAGLLTRLPAGMDTHERVQLATDACCVAFMHQACPWLEIEAIEGDAAPQRRLATPGLRWELPVLASTGAESALPALELPVLALRVEALTPAERRRMWSALLPQLAGQAAVLAARYPVDLEEARRIAQDLDLQQRIEQRPATAGDVGHALRSRTLWRSRPGVQRVRPRAGWPQLLLPETGLMQLQQAVLRVHQQLTVLDEWGFEQGRHDRRGLRLLFYGPPGTGKTLAAEAMAQALGIDLLVVDIASLVSKWIGETEKNLAGVFELAESSRALLLFDEADALFGRRTESQDANDRHANLETAFLLQRLERYEGVAVLTTNLRSNLDSAFTRRFEFIVEFPEPDMSTRQRLWQLHLPAQAPLAADVDLDELADWYALSGAQIRNAALAAAFLAAAEASAISQRHFLQAISREYDKAGKAHPGYPPGGLRPAAQAAGSAFTTVGSTHPRSPAWLDSSQREADRLYPQEDICPPH